MYKISLSSVWIFIFVPEVKFVWFDSLITIFHCHISLEGDTGYSVLSTWSSIYIVHVYFIVSRFLLRWFMASHQQRLFQNHGQSKAFWKRVRALFGNRGSTPVLQKPASTKWPRYHLSHVARKLPGNGQYYLYIRITPFPGAQKFNNWPKMSELFPEFHFDNLRLWCFVYRSLSVKTLEHWKRQRSVCLL